MKNKLITFGIVFLFLVIGAFLVFKGNNFRLGGDKDLKGCLSSAGYSWCQSKNKCLRVFEEFCSDSVSVLVNLIKQETGLDLPESKVGTFEWRFGGEEDYGLKVLDGLIFTNQDMIFADYQKLEDYLNKKFGFDLNNAADGVGGGQRGFQVGYLGCLINHRANEYGTGEFGQAIVEKDSYQVSLSCGFFNPNL